MNELEAAARAWGIEPGYHDIFGNWHQPDPRTLQALIAALSRGRAAPPRSSPAATEPLRAFQGDGKRHWTLAVQLYSLRSRRNWGIGDFTDLKRLTEIAARQGAAAIGLNPLHALFLDRAHEASPYAPNSRLFVNPLYIDVASLPEFYDDGFTARAAALRGNTLIDYPAVARLKFQALHTAHVRFGAASEQRRADFESFRSEHGETLLRFACFEVLRRQHPGKAWRDWPAPWDCPDTAALEKFRSDNRSGIEFEEYLQWNADRQLRACKEAARASGMAVGLYIDLAVGIHPDGADAWSRQRSILNGVSVGAPPDEFNTAGQDWGLAPFNPAALQENDCEPLRELLRVGMRHAGAIRIDHVLGLNRVFMIPRGMSARDGAYVRFPFETLLRVIAEESNHARCVVIGEDLGTVPEGFRDTLARYGIWVYRVMLFEREHDGRFRPPERYPAEALAIFGTHDMATLRGWLSGHDLEVKRRLGIDSGETTESRARAQQALHSFIRGQGVEENELRAILTLLGRTPSRLVSVSIEDLLGLVDQVNIPGTVDQYPNWRQVLPVTLEDLEDNAALKRIGEIFRAAGR
jgi:4-alpha-glucanotransferase